MSNVTLGIGGRSYTVACAPGEEDHVATLGRLIDGKLASLPNAGGHSETRRLLFAALLLADELHELRKDAHNDTPDDPRSDAAEALEAMAERLEQVAAELEASRS